MLHTHVLTKKPFSLKAALYTAFMSTVIYQIRSCYNCCYHIATCAMMLTLVGYIVSVFKLRQTNHVNISTWMATSKKAILYRACMSVNISTCIIKTPVDTVTQNVVFRIKKTCFSYIVHWIVSKSSILTALGNTRKYGDTVWWLLACNQTKEFCQMTINIT